MSPAREVARKRCSKANVGNSAFSMIRMKSSTQAELYRGRVVTFVPSMCYALSLTLPVP